MKAWAFEGAAFVWWNGADWIVKFRATLDAHSIGQSPIFEFEPLLAGADAGDRTVFSATIANTVEWNDNPDFIDSAYDATFTAYMAAKEHAEGMALCEDDLREPA